MSLQITQRQAVHGVFLIQIITVISIGIVSLLNPATDRNGLWIIFLVLAGLGGLWVAYWRGWDHARQVNAALLTVAVALGTPAPLLTNVNIEIISIPVVILVISGPWWMLGSALTLLSAFVLRAEGPSPYLQSTTMVSIITTLVALMMYALIVRTARLAAEVNARQAERSAAAAEISAQQSMHNSRALEEQLAEQQRLLNLVETLEAPILTVGAALLVPMVGALDSRRIERIQLQLLEHIARQHPKLVIIELTGINDLDPDNARRIGQLAQAVRLMGVQIVLSGIRAEIAISLTHEARALAELRTVRDLGEGLAVLSQSGVSERTNGR